MGILLGWLCLFCFLGLAAKGLARKAGMERANMVLMKLHKPLSGGFLLLGGGHILAVIPVFRARTGGLYLSGAVVLLLAIALILLCHTMHRHKGGWLRWHQVLTAAMLLGILFHMVIYWMDFQAYRRKIACIHLQEITISSLTDGEYVGEYDAGYIYAKVKVTIVIQKAIENALMGGKKN